MKSDYWSWGTASALLALLAGGTTAYSTHAQAESARARPAIAIVVERAAPPAARALSTGPATLARNDARDARLLASGDIAAQAVDTAHVTRVTVEEQLPPRAQLAAAEHARALVDAGARDDDRAAAHER